MILEHVLRHIFRRMVYVEELAWEEGWVIKVLVIVPSVSNRTRDPWIKINNRSGVY